MVFNGVSYDAYLKTEIHIYFVCDKFFVGYKAVGRSVIAFE